MTVVIVFSYEDHCKVVSHLQKLKYKYYTYTSAESKPYTINIDGLSKTYDEEEVKSYLNNLAIDINILKNVVEKMFTDPTTGEVKTQKGLPVNCVNYNTVGNVASGKKCPVRLQFANKPKKTTAASRDIKSEHMDVKLKRLNGETLTVAALYQKPKEGLLSNDLDQLENLTADGEILMSADLTDKHGIR
ncbi:hypothetical protein GQX74_013508 [Glossina fuscipes]|nr:hypothetical protein GQX74_013508 [Glossina fuscipes]